MPRVACRCAPRFISLYAARARHATAAIFTRYALRATAFADYGCAPLIFYRFIVAHAHYALFVDAIVTRRDDERVYVMTSALSLIDRCCARLRYSARVCCRRAETDER